MSKEYKAFECAEEVWFWFCRSLNARSDGARGGKGDFIGYLRDCEICDIERIIRRLRIEGKISRRHLRVMIKWGKLNVPPYYDSRAKRSEVRLWDSAMAEFEKVLYGKGILK